MATPDAELKVRIEAELGNFANSLKKGERDLASFGTKVDAGLKRSAQQAATTGAALSGGYAKGAGQAAMATTNLSRVLQDAPFGFIGIQNNLNPLLESFQRLRQETGSNGAAIKALAGSLTGAAGLGLALSAVSAGLLLYQQYAQSAAKETKQLSDATDALAESAAKEIAKLTILYDASQDLNRPLEQRKQLVDQLQKQFPTTFGNLTDEAILAGKAKSAYDGLTQSLINAAVVRGGEDLIADKVKNLAASLIAFQQQSRKISDAGGFLAKNNSFNVDENGDLETLTNYENRIKKEILDLRKSVQAAIGNISASDIIGGDSTKDDGKKSAPARVAEAVTENFRGAKIEVESTQNSLDAFLQRYNETAAQLGLKPLIPPTVAEQVQSNLISPIQEFNDYIGSQVFPQLQSGFENFFDDVLEKGTFSFGALGQAILKTFTSVLASEATKGILGLLNPAQTTLQKGGKGLFGLIGGVLGGGAKGGAGAAAAGTAATGGLLLPILGGLAAGGLIASLFKKKKPEPAPAFNSYSSSASQVSSDTFGGGSVVFQISGTNLIGVLNRAGAKLQRFNGTP